MSTMTAVTRSTTITRPSTGRKAPGPKVTRPALSPRHVAGVRPIACQVAVEQSSWQLTQRGVVVVTTLVAGVLGSALVTCVLAFFSVSNLPL
jgi:hypothetical protein